MDQDFWNEAYQDDPDQVVVADRILDVEVKTLPVGRALDLGCGHGPNALKLAKLGWTVVGIDWAAHAVDLAQKAAAAKKLPATFLVADVTTWKPTEQFDLVISTYALPGGNGSRFALQTAMNALKPGGTLLVAEWDRSMNEVWDIVDNSLLSPEQIANLLPGLDVQTAEVRRFEDMFTAEDDPRSVAGSAANVAFVRARKPA
jgi:SAM-dependent methyltransferase